LMKAIIRERGAGFRSSFIVAVHHAKKTQIVMAQWPYLFIHLLICILIKLISRRFT
jgi:hypothetical protein